MSDLYIYTTPPDAAVRLTLDSGATIAGVAGPANGRNDAHRLTLPEATASQGGRLDVTRDGYTNFGGRGIVDTAGASPRFVFDDVHLEPVPTTPTPPDPTPPPVGNDPESIINEVYATGRYNLATHTGCGEFTEACCVELHNRHSTMWGHVRKDPGQNQYDGHAVDAVMLLAGEGNGIFDIIHDSVSPNASPAYNYKGEPDPDLWYYPIPESDFLLRAGGGDRLRKHNRR